MEPGISLPVYASNRLIINRTTWLSNQRDMASVLYDQSVTTVRNPPRHKLGAYHIHAPYYDDLIQGWRMSGVVKFPGFVERSPGDIPVYARVPNGYVTQ